MYVTKGMLTRGKVLVVWGPLETAHLLSMSDHPSRKQRRIPHVSIQYHPVSTTYMIIVTQAGQAEWSEKEKYTWSQYSVSPSQRSNPRSVSCQFSYHFALRCGMIPLNWWRGTREESTIIPFTISHCCTRPLFVPTAKKLPFFHSMTAIRTSKAEIFPLPL